MDPGANTSKNSERRWWQNGPLAWHDVIHLFCSNTYARPWRGPVGVEKQSNTKLVLHLIPDVAIKSCAFERYLRRPRGRPWHGWGRWKDDHGSRSPRELQPCNLAISGFLRWIDEVRFFFPLAFSAIAGLAACVPGAEDIEGKALRYFVWTSQVCLL